MSLLRYVTQPDVAIDPSTLVPEWGLSDEGRRRAHAMLDQPWTTSLHTPGHTPGHPSITAHTDIGLEIIVGQACYTCAEYDTSTVALTDMHTADWHATGLDSLARLRALQPDQAHFSHDATTHMLT